MNLRRMWPFRTYSDAEIVQMAEKSVETNRRWNGWLKALNLVIALVVLALGASVLPNLLNWIADWDPEIAFALLIGILLGKLGHRLVDATLLSLMAHASQIEIRKDELLVQYHEALLELSRRDALNSHEDALAVQP